ncbi:MAG TPA: hypothetical protein VN736_24660 [Candidatus Limnocylindrales bacterium]|nr:hypothetical protein [Candidatus Limnocylindrales bacterium]
MTAQIPRLSGEDWQNWANRLLTCHYGPTNYQKVPDNDRGDAGIEGFTLSEGHAYQAYGCEGEPLKTLGRYQKQRNKMTDDIGKFIANRALLQKLLGAVEVTRWVLFVPYYDSKEIVMHAANKTEEVLKAQLPYVGQGFHVAIVHEEDFVIERDRLINAGTTTLQVASQPATPEQITDWTSSNDALAAKLQEKLARLPTLTTDEARQRFHGTVLKWYLEGQAILEALRKYPQVYEKVVGAKAHRENFLVMATVSGDAPQKILTSALHELLSTVQAEVRELHSFSAEALAHEAVADWLLRCPLDFPGVV